MFRNFENFARALDSHPSPMHGLDFCHGCRSEMRGGAGVLDAIDYFGRRGRLFYLYLRDAVGRAQDFTECFINEGNSDVFAVMMKLITDHRLPTAGGSIDRQLDNGRGLWRTASGKPPRSARSDP